MDGTQDCQILARCLFDLTFLFMFIFHFQHYFLVYPLHCLCLVRLVACPFGSVGGLHILGNALRCFVWLDFLFPESGTLRFPDFNPRFSVFRISIQDSPFSGFQSRILCFPDFNPRFYVFRISHPGFYALCRPKEPALGVIFYLGDFNH